MELFDVGPVIAIGALSFSAIVVLTAIVFFIRSAPPTQITITTGPEGSVFQKYALKYSKILEKNGVKVTVLTSKGSFENLQRLLDPLSHVDIGMVQGSITMPGIENLNTLGSVSYQPLLVFYRGAPLKLLSELTGKKVAVGPIGSGTRNLALALLSANGIKEGGPTTLLNLEAEEAAQALKENKINAAFVMSESTSSDLLKQLMRSKEIHLLSFKQAAAYSRKMDYLNVLELPEGSIDLGLNIPAQDVTLIGPMVELVATKKLHPALSDLILEAATEVHSRPGMFQRRGEFPNPVEHMIRISDDASRYFKSGKTFLYRFLPFWLASLTSRIMVVFIPLFVILIPAMRSLPAFFRWKSQTKIRRKYRELLTLEQAFVLEKDQTKREILRRRFDKIEDAVNKMKIRAAFADQFYGLRVHIDYVRQLLMKNSRD